MSFNEAITEVVNLIVREGHEVTVTSHRRTAGAVARKRGHRSVSGTVVVTAVRFDREYTTFVDMERGHDTVERVCEVTVESSTATAVLRINATFAELLSRIATDRVANLTFERDAS